MEIRLVFFPGQHLISALFNNQSDSLFVVLKWCGLGETIGRWLFRSARMHADLPASSETAHSRNPIRETPHTNYHPADE